MSTARPGVRVSRAVLLLAPLAVLVINMGQTVLFATMPMLGRAWGFHELQITSLVSLSALTFFLVSPAWGRASDSIGRKNAILIGLVGYASGTLLFNFISHIGLSGAIGGGLLYSILLSYRILHTTFMAAAHPASSAYVADVSSTRERTRAMAMVAAAIGIGVMTGPALVYFARFALLLPLYLTSVLTLLVVVMLWFYMPDYRVLSPDQRAVRVRLSYFDERYSLLLLIGFAMYAMLATVQQTLGFYFQDRLQLTMLKAIEYYAIANMLCSGAMVFMQLAVVRRVYLSPVVFLKMGLPVVALGYAMLAMSDTFAYMCVAMVVFGLGMGLAGPGYTGGASLCVSRAEQGALAGIAGSIPGLGFVLGPLLGGALYGFSNSSPYWLAAIILCAASLVAWHSPRLSLVGAGIRNA